MKILSAAELPKDFFSYRDEEVSDLVREIIQHVKTSRKIFSVTGMRR